MLNDDWNGSIPVPAHARPCRIALAYGSSSVAVSSWCPHTPLSAPVGRGILACLREPPPASSNSQTSCDILQWLCGCPSNQLDAAAEPFSGLETATQSTHLQPGAIFAAQHKALILALILATALASLLRFLVPVWYLPSYTRPFAKGMTCCHGYCCLQSILPERS